MNQQKCPKVTDEGPCVARWKDQRCIWCERDMSTLATRQTQRRPRSMGGARRVLDYRRDGRKFARCSQCHGEHELKQPVIFNLSGGAAQTHPTPLAPIMIGENLLGFVCKSCEPTASANIAALFPNHLGFPLANHHGELVDHPKCDDCGSALAYDSDGLSVLCPRCDHHSARLHE